MQASPNFKKISKKENVGNTPINGSENASENGARTSLKLQKISVKKGIQVLSTPAFKGAK